MTTMDMGKSYGGIPLGVWGVVVVGGLGIGWYLNNRQKSSTQEPQLVPTTSGGTGAGGSGWLTVEPTNQNGGNEPTEVVDNTVWGRKAVQWLIANQYDPGQADNAVRKYLYSQDLTLLEQAMVNQVLLHQGPPPEPLAPVNVPSSTPPTPEQTYTNKIPGPPSNFYVAQRGKDFIILGWQEGFNPTGGGPNYMVQVTAPEGNWEPVSTYLPLFDTRHYGPLPSGREYTFIVWAFNDFGESQPVYYRAKTNPASGPALPLPELPISQAPPPSQSQPSGTPTGTYTTVAGDTLAAISLRTYGNVSKADQIYYWNAAAIDAAARQAGKPSSAGGPYGQYGWFLYPGVTLTLY